MAPNDVDDEAPGARLGPSSSVIGEANRYSGYRRTNFLYAMRCGWSASARSLC